MERDAYIFRRTSKYPPEALYFLGLITESEYWDLLGNEWSEDQILTWSIVSAKKRPVGCVIPAGHGKLTLS